MSVDEETPLLRIHHVKRSLDARHLMMISIGGTVGTGLFVGSGLCISTAGPLGSLLAFSIISIMVFCITTSLGELATFLPISGSFNSYSSPFTLGWNYYLQWSLSLPSELAAATVVLRFWSDSEWNWVVTLSILLLLFTVNCIGARSFAETEYWLSMIKVIAVILFVIIGVLVDVGAFGLPPIYFDNYYIPDAPFKNGVQGVINVLMMAFFSFGGTELVGLTAGETKDPKRNVPKAVHGTFLRILLFYISSIFVMGLVIRHDDPRIQFNNIGMNPTVSPFTLVFELVPIFGSRALAHVMNFVILSAVLSAGNSAMYASSRTLMSLAIEGKAPRIFSVVNSRGVPFNSLLLTTFIGSFSFLGILFGEAFIFEKLLSLTGITGVLTWISISVIHLRFRAALKAQNYNLEETLPYIAPLYPFLDFIGLLIGGLIIILQAYSAIKNDGYYNIFSSFVGVPIFLFLFVSFKLIAKSRLVDPKEADLETDNIWTVENERILD